jgi:hypothetical protein
MQSNANGAADADSTLEKFRVVRDEINQGIRDWLKESHED